MRSDLDYIYDFGEGARSEFSYEAELATVGFVNLYYEVYKAYPEWISSLSEESCVSYGKSLSAEFFEANASTIKRLFDVAFYKGSALEYEDLEKEFNLWFGTVQDNRWRDMYISIYVSQLKRLLLLAQVWTDDKESLLKNLTDANKDASIKTNPFVAMVFSLKYGSWPRALYAAHLVLCPDGDRTLDFQKPNASIVSDIMKPILPGTKPDGQSTRLSGQLNHIHTTDWINYNHANA